MVKEVTLYIEGDTKKKGSGNSITLRQGFNEFFGKWAKEEQIEIRFDIKLPGDRGKAVNVFLNDKMRDAESFAVLLIDSEREKEENKSAKDFCVKISPIPILEMSRNRNVILWCRRWRRGFWRIRKC